MDWIDGMWCLPLLTRGYALYIEMVAPAAALVGLNRSNLCGDNKSCSVPGSAATKRASRVLSGIFVHQAAESSYCVIFI